LKIIGIFKKNKIRRGWKGGKDGGIFLSLKPSLLGAGPRPQALQWFISKLRMQLIMHVHH
jgi:hypothetical protein